jgi:hypothetical protein
MRSLRPARRGDLGACARGAGVDSAGVQDSNPELNRPIDLAPPDSADPLPASAVRRATMRGSRLLGLVGFGVGAGLAASFGRSPWISAVVGFIVFAELPDVIYRVRARRGDVDPLLPAWDASEAYLVTLRRWRRRARDEAQG